MFQKQCLGLEDAQRAIATVLSAAAAEGHPIAVAVVDDQGRLIGFARMDGTPLRAQRYARRKAYTAAVLGRDTLVLRDLLRKRERGLADYGDRRLTTLPGGLVVKLGEQVVGGIGVSGPSAGRPLDEHLARLGLAAMGLGGG